MRKALAVGTIAASLAALALASPASAADGTTAVSFTVVDGTLAIAVTPAATAANTSVLGTSKIADISLGLTTVNDTRSTTTGWSYSAAVPADYKSTTTTATIAKTASSFWIPVAPTSTTGSPTFPVRVSTPTAVKVDGTSGELLKASATTVNDATFTPFLRVTVSSTAPLETFTGSVTQSVV